MEGHYTYKKITKRGTGQNQTFEHTIDLDSQF